MARYKWVNAHDWLQDYLQAHPEQAHSIAMSLALKLDCDSIQDLFQSDMDAEGYFDDLDEVEAEEALDE